MAKNSGSGLKANFAIVGDAGLSPDETEPLRASLLRAGVRRLVIPGDNLYDLSLGYEKVWQPWKAQGFELTCVALGNHTVGYDIEMRYFGLPTERHAVQAGDCLFLALNSDNEATVAEQMAWFERELRQTQARFVFPVFHHPPMTITTFHAWEEKREFQLALRPVLERHRAKITALIVGHDHTAGLYRFNGLPLIVSGAGAQVRDVISVESTNGEAIYSTEWVFAERATWARLEVDSAIGQARIHFVETETDRVVYSAALTDGRSEISLLAAEF